MEGGLEQVAEVGIVAPSATSWSTMVYLSLRA
jgi:hypothetical protein